MMQAALGSECCSQRLESTEPDSSMWWLQALGQVASGSAKINFLLLRAH